MQMLESYFSRVRECELPATEDMIRVVIVDTHTLMREALHKFVAALPLMNVCASLATLRDVSIMAWNARAQVIILGSSIQISDCLDFIDLLHENHDSTGIVVIQRCLSPETTLTLIKYGVHGLLGEDACEDDLAKAIIAAATENTFLDRRARNMLNTSVSRASVHLTKREVEVLSLLKCGETNVRIAHALGMKEKTVEKHLSHIYEKLNINSRVEAVLQTQRLHI